MQLASYASTHAFAYGSGSKYMVCPCGAEQDVTLRDGKAVRLYRAKGGEWSPAVSLCPKYIEPVESKDSFDWRPNESIPEDHMAAMGDPPPKFVPPKESKPFDLKELRRLNPGMFEPEIINGCDVDEIAKDVDLSIAYSPVLRLARACVYPQSYEEMAALIPIEVTPLENDMYRVYFPEGPRDIPASSVKVMRARYLLRRGELARALPSLPADVRERWMKLYHIPWMPPPTSPLGRQVQTGQVITIANPGDKPIDFVSLMKVLSTPDASIPEVCPTLDK